MTQPSKLKLVDLETSGRDPRALNRLDWIALWLLAVALLIAPLWAGVFATPDRIQFLGAESPFGLLDSIGVSLLFVLVALASGFVVWREARRPVAIGAIPGVAAGMVLLGLWAVFSVVRSHSLALSFNALAALLSALAVGGLIARLGRDRRGFAVLLLTIILGGSIISAMGIREFLFWVSQHINNHRVFATFVNPDFLAGYLLVVLPLTLAAFVAASQPLLRLVLGIGLALQSACLLLTGSRAGAGMLVVTLVVWLALALRSGSASKRGKAIVTGLLVVLVFGGLASGPTWLRIAGSAPPPSSGSTHAPAPASLPALPSVADQQGYSGSFRRYTWSGTVQMARSNPLLGTGIGTFEIAYPRYSETAFTAHAHNSYLQWMAEAGIPALLFLLIGLAAATAFGSSIVILRRGDDEADMPTAPTAPTETSLLTLEAPRLVLAGLLASICATLLHSLTDSDWYIVATLLTFGAVVGLLCAECRNIAPLAVQLPRPQSRGMLAIGACIAVFLLWRGEVTAIARVNEAAETTAVAANQVEPAISASRAAADADPLDPEPKLDLGMLYGATQRPELALQALQDAVRVEPTGKPYYRLGQFYARAGDLEKAIDAFKHSRAAEPHNVQNLRVLAETLQMAGKTQEAREVYKDLVALENAPYGKVRAVPEMVETDFATAHAGLADIAAGAQNWQEAATESAGAANVLREFWSFFQMDFEVRQRTPSEKQEKLVALYDRMLTLEQDALKHLGRSAEASKAAEEESKFDAWRAADLQAHPPATNDAGGGANG